MLRTSTVVVLLAASATPAIAQAPDEDDEWESALDELESEEQRSEQAQEGDEEDLFRLDEVVVTASRSERRLSEAPVATELITREDIEASGAQDAGELLEEHLGVQVTRNFRGAGVRIRGLDASYVLVLVDGQRTIGRTEGTIDLSRFSADEIERVEIVRGASSALYGSDAIGGVINIITRDGEDDFEAEADASVGVFEHGVDDKLTTIDGDMLDFSGGVGGRLGDFRLRLSGMVRATDAFDDDRQEDADVASATRASAFVEYELGGSMGWEMTRRLEWEAEIGYRRRDTQGIDTAPPRAVFDRFQRQSEVRASLGPRIKLSDGHEVSITGHFALLDDRLDLDQRGSDRDDRLEDASEQLGQLTIQYDGALDDYHLLTVGYETLFQILESPRIDRTGRRARLAPFTQWEWTVYEKGDVFMAVVPGARLDVDTQFGTHASPKLTVRFDPEEKLVLRLSGGRGFRAPSFGQQLLRFENPTVGYVVEGNPALEPETSWNADLSAEWRPLDWLGLGLGVHRTEIEQLIDFQLIGSTPGGSDLYRYVNRTSAHTQGIEVAVRLRPTRGVRLELGYALTDAQDDENDRRLQGRALHQVSFKARYLHRRSGLSTQLRGTFYGSRPFYESVDGTPTDPGVTERADPYLLADLRFGWKVSRRFEIYAGIDNVLGTGTANRIFETLGGDEFSEVLPRTYYAGARGRY